MKRMHFAVAAMVATALLAFAQETPKPVVDTYSSLADAILAVNKTETGLVKSILEGHRHAAEGAMRRGDHEAVAANMALFGNEGDNAIGGIRKRLVEGGHHHNAEGEAKGIFEPGYVVVTKEAKVKILACSAAYRKATTDAERKKAWDDFMAIAAQLLAGE
jgi:hypothetical protein